MIPKFLDRLLCADEDCGGLTTGQRYLLAFSIIFLLSTMFYVLGRAIIS